MRVACIFLQQPCQLAEFAQACLRFSPQIAIREPNVIFVEVGKCRNLYSEFGFQARLRVLLKRFGYSARVSIAESLPLSLALAEFRESSVNELPIESLLIFGSPFREDAAEKKAITQMIQSLKRLGIHSIEQFRKLPTQEFPSRFGSLGLYCRQQIEGEISLPWPAWQPPEKFLERVELLESEACNELEPLLFRLKQVLDRVLSRLRGRYLAADQLHLSIELEKLSIVKNPVRTWEFEFIAPQTSTPSLLPILRERLNRDLERDPLESSAIALSVEILKTSLSVGSQRNFFHSRDELQEALGSFFGQIEEFLGKGQVFWASVTENRYPEKSWRRMRKPEAERIDLCHRYPKRPTRIFKTPVPLRLIENRLCIKGRNYRIKNWSSVERLSVDWLDGTIPRNYYQVELIDGPVLWIFSDPSHHFFLHGYYE